MEYKIYDEETLTRIGEDIITTTIYEIGNGGILEKFCNGVSNMDYKKEYSDSLEFQKEFNFDVDAHYIFFHLVMFTATLIKFNASDYIMKKKLFGGYENDIVKSVYFNSGLENGLQEFRQRGKFTEIRQKHFCDENEVYYYGDYLSNFTPYFFFEVSFVDMNDFIDRTYVSFAKNIAYIREPRNLKIVSAVFYERAIELNALAEEILRHYFLRN